MTMYCCMCTLLVVLVVFKAQGLCYRVKTFAEKKQFGNLTVESSSAFESTSATELTCARQCALHEAVCASFTFTPSSLPASSGICRGHSTVMTQSKASESSPQAVFFDYEWLHTACSNTAECWEPNSECFAGQCLCTPGYYYSISTRSCLKTCPEGQLQSSFVRYADRGIKDNNWDTARGEGTSQCLELCANHSQCLTVDVWDNKDCHLQNVTAQDVPNDFTHYANIDEYQKMCL